MEAYFGLKIWCCDEWMKYITKEADVLSFRFWKICMLYERFTCVNGLSAIFNGLIHSFDLLKDGPFFDGLFLMHLFQYVLFLTLF